MPDVDLCHSLSIIIGIDHYIHDIPPLRTALNNFRRLADLLAQHHGYDFLFPVADVIGNRLT